MNAEYTNALTNAMHATCLLLYFAAAARGYARKDARFGAAMVGFFLILFLLKVLGVYVHYVPGGPGARQAWFVISIGVVAMNHLALTALQVPPNYRIGGVALSAVCSAIFVVTHDFTFIALPFVLIFLAAAWHCRGWLKAGLYGVVASNMVWIVARKGTELIIGETLPVAWRYDNDVYHLMLIVSTFVIYKGFARGDACAAPQGEVEEDVARWGRAG